MQKLKWKQLLEALELKLLTEFWISPIGLQC